MNKLYISITLAGLLLAGWFGLLQIARGPADNQSGAAVKL